MIARMKSVYNSTKKWMAYISLIVSVIGLYFRGMLGPFGDYLFPASLALVAAITLETLQSLESKILDERDFTDHDSLAGSVNDLCKFAARCKDEVRLEIIAATGGTTIGNILPAIIQASSAKRFHVCLHIVDAKSPMSMYFPDHWTSETDIIIGRIQREYGQVSNVSFEVRTYDHLPLFHGILINKKYLALGFFGWTGYPHKQLSGAQKKHRIFKRRNQLTEMYFEAFENWIEYSPSKVILNTQAKDVG